MMVSIKYVVFDVGGVLLDWKNALKIVSGKLNITDAELLDFIYEYLVDLELGSITDDVLWKAVVEKYESKVGYHELSNTWILEQPKIEHGWDLARRLSQKGHRLAICTNNWLGVMENAIKNIPEFSLFTDIIDSSQEKVRKPEANMYRLVEQRLGVGGRAIYFIDDNKANLDAAKAIGWGGYLYRDSKSLEDINALILNEIN